MLTGGLVGYGYLLQSSNIWGTVLCFGFIVFIVIAISTWVHNSKQYSKKIAQMRDQQRRLLENSRLRYQKSLEELQHHPTNAALRQQTLDMGRQYSNLTRYNKGVTIFDEIALSNDINAACAGATVIHQNQKEETGAPSTETRLEKLTDLKKRGIISDDEYSKRRQQIIDSL